MFHFLFFLGFPGSILERKLGCILLGWGCIHRSLSHLLSLGWSCFSMGVQQSRKIFPGKSLLEARLRSRMVIVWTFAPLVSTFHTPLSKVLALCPPSLPTHGTSLQSQIWELQGSGRVAEPCWFSRSSSFPLLSAPWGHHLVWQVNTTWWKESWRINGFAP